jgi:ubiquinone/menaquinone biosynthesis C-methylase UbiE
VGFYREHVLPRLVDCVCGMPPINEWRAQVAEGLSGRLVEIGFGSGLNVKYYPTDLDVVLAVEPSAVARRMSEKRIVASSIPVQHVGLDGQSLPLGDASCDSALSTFTLCTVPDPSVALAEILRVLRPGGSIHFLEHGIAPDPGVATWQRRLDPLQGRLADGCHITRDFADLVTQAGFQLERCDQGYSKGPKPWNYFTLGVATKPL